MSESVYVVLIQMDAGGVGVPAATGVFDNREAAEEFKATMDNDAHVQKTPLNP